MPPLAPLQQIPAHLLSVADYRQQAEQHLPPAVWAYLEGGSGDELTLRRNQQAFDQVELLPRVLRSLAQGHTGIHLQGRDWPVPWMLAPVGHQKVFHPEGERATAQAAQALQVPMLVSCLSSTPFAQITTHCSAPVWLQLYWQPQRHHTLQLIRLAEAAGMQALVLTVDAPVSGLRYRQQKAGFVLPQSARAAHPFDTAPTVPDVFGGWMAQAPLWDDLIWLQQQTGSPVWLKGVLHPDDARLAVAAGVQGLIVSNHGGRSLDGVPASLAAVPAIRQAVGDEFPVLLDSGIRRGTDVIRALMQGADAVLIGRPYLYGLATAGALGVAHVLQLLQQELAIGMALCGQATVADLRALRSQRA